MGDIFGTTPLHNAACKFKTPQGQKAFVDFIDKHPESAITIDLYGNTPLFYFLSRFRTTKEHSQWAKENNNKNTSLNYTSPKESIIEEKLIKFFKEHPETLEIKGATILSKAARNFKTAKSQVGLVEVFKQNFELAKESSDNQPSALYEAVSNFKTPEGQRAIITLLYEHPEIKY